MQIVGDVVLVVVGRLADAVTGGPDGIAVLERGREVLLVVDSGKLLICHARQRLDGDLGAGRVAALDGERVPEAVRRGLRALLLRREQLTLALQAGERVLRGDAEGNLLFRLRDGAVELLQAALGLRERILHGRERDVVVLGRHADGVRVVLHLTARRVDRILLLVLCVVLVVVEIVILLVQALALRLQHIDLRVDRFEQLRIRDAVSRLLQLADLPVIGVDLLRQIEIFVDVLVGNVGLFRALHRLLIRADGYVSLAHGLFERVEGQLDRRFHLGLRRGRGLCGLRGVRGVSRGAHTAQQSRAKSGGSCSFHICINLS